MDTHLINNQQPRNIAAIRTAEFKLEIEFLFGALGYSIVNAFESARECKRVQERKKASKQERKKESKQERKKARETGRERERGGEGGGGSSDLKGFWAFQQKEKSVISRLQSQGGGAPPSFISIVFNDGD